ncbi:glycosyltransferase family protein [Paenibacillus riograndensis]|uniref:Glycosyltransferase n=1 Tax=Paenibacillus riograndensis SBR5 TaxID=1073571 RepID=A0A0E4HI65_9BACL|nr:hypothetical protein [Paenibacillus riograndensis]CQR58544.1 hypothetical protein PRIO_6197 [Paenibacillus riograndensis SBR5]
MVKIAYLMHIDWNWAKQRPHFIAEELSAVYDVDLIYIKQVANSSRYKKQEVCKKLNIRKLYKLPYSGKLKIIKKVECLLNKKIRSIDFSVYDLIWVTSPIIFNFIDFKHINNNSNIIYDCMDDYLEFTEHKKDLSKHKQLEEQLVCKSKMIITSSSTLKERLQSRYVEYIRDEEIYVINNAVSQKWLDKKDEYLQIVNRYSETSKYVIGYVGTISDWFDFDLLMYILSENKRVEFKLIGPSTVKKVLHPRITYIGAVSHDSLVTHVRDVDAFIMPFVVNKLIEAVDPVKIYEYIMFDKPIFCIRYPEAEKFYEYVSLYRDKHEVLGEINKMISGSHEVKESYEYLRDNTWIKRFNEIKKVINLAIDE